ncbi:MAG: cyclic pyranopterin monophosphate synthase MoaC [Synechococcales cyanobacterium CRU_2_2]|nr:cyclic pyranopterin monophosphate synthase MoaC [Synechococcales cyanobacterium CRU_2_2]
MQSPGNPIANLTHLDDSGTAHMVDVSRKAVTLREAVAEGFVRMLPETLAAIAAGNTPKGDVISTARLAGIMAAKQTANLIPLCHPLPLKKIGVEIIPDPSLPGYRIEALVRTKSETGVEMEALTAVSIAALTLYDMAKALEKSMTIENIRLIRKLGGKSGNYQREVPSGLPEIVARD